MYVFNMRKEKLQMNKHVEKAMELRNNVPMVSNCAQTIMCAYADELGLTEEQAASIACNFGGGMKCGGVCGAVTAGLMVLGAKGVESPAVIGQFRQTIAQNHEGMLDCSELLRANIERGGDKKTHCDGMIRESIEMIDKLLQE